MHNFGMYAKKEVIGQNKPIEFLDLAIGRLGRIKIFEGVDGLLTLAGPGACGKNFVAKVIARFMERSMLVLHMDEFGYADDIDRLLGPKGVLEKWVSKHPDGLVICEDIDKADHAIQRALAAIVADGAPDDPNRYKRTVFILTFSLNDPAWYEKRFVDSYYENTLLRQGKFYEEISKVLAPDIEGNMVSLFDPQILTVMSEADLALFYALDLRSLWKISQKVLDRTLLQLQGASLPNIKIKDSKALSMGLLLEFSPYLNAKRIAHKLPALLSDLIATHCNEAKLCTFTISSKAQRWLSEFFDPSFDLKYFVKFERQFRLSWRVKALEKSGHIHLVLDDIKEVESLKIENRLPYADRLAIRASHIGFKDVAGQIRVKNELKSIIKVLQNEKGLKHFGITLPKGLLLYGPEGVGKTMLVKAFAKEAGLPYLYLQNSDLFDEVLIQEVYARARVAAPVLVVLEEVDTKGIVEGSYTSIPTGTLCDMIDHAPAEPDNYIFTVATARDQNEVPEELIRPGRIDQSVEVPELDKEARRFFAKKILEKPHKKGIDIERITRYMSGMNGYELERIAKEAALDALRQGKEELTEEIIIDRINTIKYGHKLEKKRFKNFEEDLKKSAWHEAAHAITSLHLLPDVEIEQVTVIPRSEALGLVSYMQDAIETNMSKDEILGNIGVLLAGRMATIKKFGPDKGMETGAFSDLQEATLYAYSAVAQFGMDEEMPDVSAEILIENINSDLFKEKIESRVLHWVEIGRKRAKKVIDKEWEMIEAVAKRLLKEELIEGSELKSMVLKSSKKRTSQ
ncbi:AAA family ATPase [Hydrogenimonas sp.]